MNTMRHYEKISDVSVCWGIEMDPKHKRLPPNKLNIKKEREFLILGKEKLHYMTTKA